MEKQKREDDRRERVRRMQMREKVGKSRDTVFFPMFCGSGESKSRLAKAAGAEPSGQIAPHCGERFGKCLEVSVSKSARLCSTVWTTLRR